MNFSHEEIARLNTMIGIALMSGKIDMDEISESIHKKIADELINEQTEEKEVVRGCGYQKKNCMICNIELLTLK